MKYLNIDNKNKYIIDIETNGLSPTKIHCAVIKNKETQQIWNFINDGSSVIYHELKSFIEQRKEAIFIGHNIISFDSYWISYFCGIDWNYDQTIDTLILSYLYNPALEGGHSLEDYGLRFKLEKIDHQDWIKYSPEMLKRCQRDVDITERTYDALVKKMITIGFSELSCWIEHKTREIIDQQERNGCYFFTDRAESLLRDLQNKQAHLSESIHKLFPPELEEMGRYTRRYRKDGSDFASYERHLQEYPFIRDNDDGTYSTLDYSQFNIGSPKQRIDRLMRMGYTATDFTPTGQPKVDEEALVKFADQSGKQEIKAIAEWLVLQGRITMLGGNPQTGSKGWLGWVQPDHRIHGKILTCAATSRRMIHNNPNTANVPHPLKAKYGREMRACWGVEPNKGLKQVGTDASGLENVGLLHYLNNPLAEKVLNQKKPNDIHSMNARKLTEVLGREIDREWGAKTSYYATLYGAYPKKLGQIVKGTVQDGEKVKTVLLKSVPGLYKLVDEIENEYIGNNGFIKCVDGGYVRPFSTGSCLNYRIQSLGAVVMKLAAIRLKENVIKEGLWFKQLLTVHDEWQKETEEKMAEEIGKVAIKSIEQAAEELNFNVKLTGEYRIGNDWSDCH